METRLSNTFKTTNITNFNKAILKRYKSSISYKTLKQAVYFLNAVEFCSTYWHSNWHNLGYISGNVAKPNILESPQKSLKTSQHSYHEGYPLRNNDTLKTWKICVFFGDSFFKIKITDILNLQWIKYLGKGLSYWKN